MSVRYRLHRLVHSRWYRREQRAGRVYLEAEAKPIQPRALPDRSNELRSRPRR